MVGDRAGEAHTIRAKVLATHRTPARRALWSWRTRTIANERAACGAPRWVSRGRRDDPFRLPGCAAWRQAGDGGRCVPQRGEPLRPDERLDVGRAASRLEERPGGRREPAQKAGFLAARL